MQHRQPVVQEFAPVNIIQSRAPRLSFCVYGNKLKYITGAIHNAVLTPTVYPGWIARFYMEQDTQLIRVLTDLNAEVLVTKGMHTEYGQIHPVTWRFLALTDPLVDRVQFRDADSRISDRDYQAVLKWLESGKNFHRMKEDVHMSDPPILSGMWGAKAEFIRNIEDLLLSYREWKYPMEPLPGDFYFLENKVWPIMKQSCIFHGTSNDRYGEANKFPPHKPSSYGYVGARVEDTEWGM